MERLLFISLLRNDPKETFLVNVSSGMDEKTDFTLSITSKVTMVLVRAHLTKLSYEQVRSLVCLSLGRLSDPNYFDNISMRII